ncbi:ABC transporter [Mycobacterium sp. NPDC050551]|uniref:ABC transporter n=1 Tax=Mycobacterium sp. NPDC050551 TaxID=3155407 RepID=UPI0034211A1D
MTAVVPDPAPGRAVRRLAARRLRRSAAAAAVTCGAVSALFAGQYEAIRRSLDDAGFHDLAGNPIERVLLGPPVALDDPGGFTVWRTGTAALALASAWGGLAATRVTRGEEDAGRWNLLLGGRLGVADVVIRHLIALAGSSTMIGGAVTAGLLAGRTDPVGALVHGAGIACTALTSAATGVLAAQVMPSRSAATGLTVGALGAGLALRMIADSSPRLGWLAWLTPFGLAARSAPFAANRIVPLAVSGTFPIVLAGAAVVAARRRDLGAGIVPASGDRPARTRLLHSVHGFALRRTARTTLGWAAGITAAFLMAGAMLASVLQYFQTNPRFEELAAAAGVTGLDSVNAFIAPLFSLLPVPTGLYAALRLATMIADEKAGRWTLLLAQPISRVRLVSAEIAVTAAGVVALHGSAAVAMWSGAKITGAPLHFADSLAGAMNPLPVALLAVGAAAVGAGWRPTATGAIGAVPIVGGFLVNAVVPALNAPAWVANLSPWAHLGAVPAAPPQWEGSALLLLTGALLTACGVYGYAERDVTT